MTDATFTTIASKTYTNAYGKTYRASLIHRSEGFSAAGSVKSLKPEVYLVRIEPGDGTFFGQAYKVENRSDAEAHFERLGK
jgi:hypothetical protein